MQHSHDSQKKIKFIFSFSLMSFSSIFFLLYFHDNLILSCFKLGSLAQSILCDTQITARRRLWSFQFCKSFTIIFRYQVEKQILGEINGNSASWNLECDSSKVSYCPISFCFQSLLQSVLPYEWIGGSVCRHHMICTGESSAQLTSLLSVQVGILKHF